MFILYIREIKDGDDTTCRTNDYFLSPAGYRCPISTLMWKPAHSPTDAVIGQAEYPSITQIQMKGGSRFIPYDYLCRKDENEKKSDEDLA
jgi:hypothetical protein